MLSFPKTPWAIPGAQKRARQGCGREPVSRKDPQFFSGARNAKESKKAAEREKHILAVFEQFRRGQELANQQPESGLEAVGMGASTDRRDQESANQSARD